MYLKSVQYFLVISNFCNILVFSLFTPVIQINQGKIRGLRSLSGQNRYYSIPYAVSERFQPPKDPPKWSGTFNAVRRFKSCAQTVAYLKLGTESCLELDVYTPEQANPGDNLPVFVFIHGGGYYYGSKWNYDPEFLVTKNIVAVIINYRVGVLGFLCLHDVANLGLKDQVAALKWIQKNIAAFGGDPDNVTISGQSAGASAAAMHLLSKSSKGLFHKAILLSGTSITPWAFNLEPQRAAFEDASKMVAVTNERSVYNAFLKAPINDLLNNCRDTSINPRYFKYSPCVDSNFSDPFFHDTPYNVISLGNLNQVPIISGYTDTEGMLFYGLHDKSTLKDWDDNFIDKLPSVFSASKNKEKIMESMRSYYFSNKSISSVESIRGVVNFYSDWLAYSTADAFSKLMSRYSDQPVFNYMFSYEGDRNFAKFLFGDITGLKGASHSDDIFYIFKPAGVPLLLSKPDKLFIDRLTTMLANFMKFGDPTPNTSRLLPTRWVPTTANRSITMRLGRELTVIDTPSSHKGEFFLKLLCEYGLKGYVPCDGK